jgi:pentatricopeptide repeat protein
MPENAELLSSIGALYLKLGEFDEAFEYFGNSMMYDSSFSNV